LRSIRRTLRGFQACDIARQRLRASATRCVPAAAMTEHTAPCSQPSFARRRVRCILIRNRSPSGLPESP